MPTRAGDAFLSVDAPAKINLFLHVTGRREDGYHLLDSIVAFTEVGDRLSVAPSSRTLSLEMSGPFAPDLAGLTRRSSDNLVLQAAEMLRAAAGLAAGARLRLVKNLPVAAGIGGGSADAAAALRLLAHFWNVSDAEPILRRIAPKLGADVPVCLRSASARFSGIGDIVEPAPAPPSCGVVLANAREPVPTPAVFRARTGPFRGTGRRTAFWGTDSGFDEFIESLALCANDLSDAAQRVSPVIAVVLSELRQSSGCRLARLSGSGGTCFGLYETTETAEQAAAALSRSHADWWVVSTQFRRCGTSPAVF